MNPFTIKNRDGQKSLSPPAKKANPFTIKNWDEQKSLCHGWKKANPITPIIGWWSCITGTCQAWLSKWWRELVRFREKTRPSREGPRPSREWIWVVTITSQYHFYWYIECFLSSLNYFSKKTREIPLIFTTNVCSILIHSSYGRLHEIFVFRTFQIIRVFFPRRSRFSRNILIQE